MGKLRYEAKWMIVDVFEEHIEPLHQLLSRFEEMDEEALRPHVLNRLYVNFEHQERQCKLADLSEVLLEGICIIPHDDGKLYLKIRWLGFEWDSNMSAGDYQEEFEVPPPVNFKITDEDTNDVSQGFVGFFCDDTWYFVDAG